MIKTVFATALMLPFAAAAVLLDQPWLAGALVAFPFGTTVLDELIKDRR